MVFPREVEVAVTEKLEKRRFPTIFDESKIKTNSEKSIQWAVILIIK